MTAQDLNLQPGDIITVRATVKQAMRGVGVLVELFSKTDQYDAWIREDLVVDRLVEAADADEPPVGSYVKATHPNVQQPLTVWQRDAEEGWLLVNREGLPGRTWPELKANSTSWRLLYSGDDD